MHVPTTLVLAAALAVCADVPDAAPFRAGFLGAPDLSALSTSPAQPSAPGTSAQSSPNPSTTLRAESRLEIIRYVDGEFAKLVEPLPRGKKGFTVSAGKPLDVEGLRNVLRLEGAAVNQGDTIQITGIEFRSREIVFQINGGGKKHFRLRDHVQVSLGGAVSSAPASGQVREGTGATLILAYGRPLPDMSPDDLKRDLSPLLDFSNQRSATVNWVDTLPPQFKQAIADHQAVVGMDHDMVVAALGRPGKKVRERDPNGNETEDWIYGSPPAKTVFVTFAGDKVIRVEAFN